MTHRTFTLLLLYFFFWPALSAQNSNPDIVEGELLIRLEEDVRIDDFIRRINTGRSLGAGLSWKRSVGRQFNIHLLEFDPVVSNGEHLLAYLSSQPGVWGVQYNHRIAPRQVPDDPDYELQWGLEVIGASEVWDVTTGGVNARGDTLVVAVLDSGFDPQHEDLRENIWRNPGEIPGDGIDNDGNNYTDDLMGYDFIEKSGTIGVTSHGTSVAGLVGATGNNGIGVSGVTWNIKLMLLRIGSEPDIIEAYQYVIDQRRRYNETNGAEGAFVVATNASFGSATPRFCSDAPVWGGMYDLMGEVGVLTGAGTRNDPVDVEEVGDIPTSCPSDFLISVLNLNINGQKEQDSAFGKVSIDIGSPGEGSYTIKPFGLYGLFNGNSAAAPHTTGAIALLYSIPCLELAQSAIQQPEQTARFIRQVILDGAEPLAELSDLTATGGRLNVFRSMELIQQECGSSTGELELLNLYPNPVNDLLTIEYQTPDFEDYELRVFNVLGQLIYRDDISPPRFGEKREEIPVGQWAPGTYFLTLQSVEKRLVKAFVVY